ncbi:MAG: cytochrome c-type biogenesis protein CcmH [Gemmatimonadota bacterium]|nr:cytochrome c-type biogenesis protein CcmH [Gemmatimonadota bacterium]
MTVTRRRFFRDAAAIALPIVPLIAVRRLHAQQVTQSFAGPMEQDAYRPVQKPAKAGAKPSMTDAQRDDCEHTIKCQCGCSLDVYTCRTTDFSCSVSPAMHEDVMSLVSGGYGASEIRAAFQAVYGERVLMSPIKSGFNWLGYTLPSIAIAGGALFLAVLMRRWRSAAPAPALVAPLDVPATDEEISRISAAIRKDQ